MDTILDSVLDGRGFGWALVRYAIIVTPAIIALVALTNAFD